MRTVRSRFSVIAIAAGLTLACKPEQRTDAQRANDAQPIAATQPSEPVRPKLVVVVVVDQMRFDYFDRFGSQWQRGFGPLREQGRYFAQAYHEHAMTETGPGHATISTGTDPARHGIIANAWFDRATGTKLNAVADPNATPQLSAANLVREGVGDWMQAADPSAVVIAMALKDRAAILLGGQHPDAAIWYDDALGEFTSSTAYAETTPAWVAAYNAKDRAAALYGEHGWTLSRPGSDYGDSRQSTDPKLVATFNDYALTKQFPHVIDRDGKAPRNIVRDTPFGDRMTLELAREAITTQAMGEDAVTDLLLISLSGGDYAGHRYGPNSVEIHEYYLQIDAALGEFVANLDATIGTDDYVLVLASDHGVAPMPEYSKLDTAGRFEAKQIVPPLLEQAAEQVGLGPRELPRLELINGVDLVFDEAVAEADRTALRAALAELLRAQPGVADAWTRDELAGAEQRNTYADAWRRSFHPDRSPDVQIQLAPGVVSYPEGTGHGQPYDDDQRVPLLIRGPGWSGVDNERVSMTDLAPTIAEIVGVAVGANIDGHAITRD